jgi:drug/metabolite transporter (DMT)-like permease
MAELLAWFELLLVLLGTSVGQVLYKLYVQQRKLVLLLLAFSAFGAGPVLTYLALRVLNVGQVYMSTAATQVAVLVLSRYVLKESITRQQILATAVIVAGVVVYAI